MAKYKYCARCHKYHAYNEECPNKPKKRFSYHRDENPVNVRRKAGWKETSKYIREQRDDNRCQLCARGLLRTIDKDTIAKEVHHIIPLADGGKEFDHNNLISLCYWHHKFVEGKKEYIELLQGIAKEQNEKVGKNPLVG